MADFNNEKAFLTLSCLGARFVHVVSLVIYIFPNNGAINIIQGVKLVVNMLAIHRAL